ncbi:hypothetical protein BpHYR1_021422 [Brachionus plicatilis]|uniref:Uncharacterized protein n=1 Tax=Brachionus plicatilis TaxID=10195 RepID=A0A3M7PUT0_BRAPC|nr:hypothetical protein BpHYR1_021422 [Brachionus plicatilis]
MGISQPILNVAKNDSNLTQENLDNLSTVEKNDFIRNWLEKIEIHDDEMTDQELLGELDDIKIKKSYTESDKSLACFTEENANSESKDSQTNNLSDINLLKNTSESTNASSFEHILEDESLKPVNHARSSNEKVYSFSRVKDNFKNYLELFIQNEKIKPEKILFLKQTKSQPKRLDPLRAFLFKEFPEKK